MTFMDVKWSVKGSAQDTYGGLVDLKTPEEFDEELQKSCWGALETNDTGNPPSPHAKFKNWFRTFKQAECKELLPSARKMAGLGDRTRRFTTNDVERENMNIKREMDWQEKPWDEAANHLHARVLRHYEELKTTVHKGGFYRLTSVNWIQSHISGMLWSAKKDGVT